MCVFVCVRVCSCGAFDFREIKTNTLLMPLTHSPRADSLDSTAVDETLMDTVGPSSNPQLDEDSTVPVASATSAGPAEGPVDGLDGEDTARPNSPGRLQLDDLIVSDAGEKERGYGSAVREARVSVGKSHNAKLPPADWNASDQRGSSFSNTITLSLPRGFTDMDGRQSLSSQGPFRVMSSNSVSRADAGKT